MYATILKIAWPYLQRFLANKAAGYLQERREQRRQGAAPQKEAEEYPPHPPETYQVVVESDTSSGDAIWFALSGVLLGSAFSLILYLLLNDEHSRLQT